MSREEAIETLRNDVCNSHHVYDCTLQTIIEACKTLIPELKESEDERIRKELLEEIEFIIPHEDETDSEGLILPSYRTRIKRYKSYLEKQKEQTEDLSTRLNGVMQEYVKAGKDEEEQEHRLKCYQLFWDALGDSEFFKQKEQKPAEWSEEDEDFINMLILHFNYLIHKGGDSVETYKSYIEKLKSLRPQPKQEWSEEDKYILKNIHDFVKENTINPNRVNCAKECLNWLNSLPERFNLQQKVELSEEDEEMLDLIIEIFTVNHANGVFGTGNRVINGLNFVSTYTIIAWLKSLRPKPSWKPSEEQMEALNEVINTLAVSKYPHESDYLFNILNGLRKNLKSYSHEIH